MITPPTLTPPRRSVTRFFIPLIDVLILLFCIFLLMPLVSGPPGEDETTPKAAAKDQTPTDPEVLKKALAAAKSELEEAKAKIARMEADARLRLSDRLNVRVLYVDGKDGTLYYLDPKRVNVETDADVLRLVTTQRELTSAAGVTKELFFLILLPTRSSFPTQEQIDRVRQWFKAQDVPIGFDRVQTTE